MKLTALIILIWNLSLDAQLKEVKVARSIEEIDEQTELVLGKINYEVSDIESIELFRKSLLKEKVSRIHKSGSIQRIRELLELASTGEISNNEIIKKLKSLRDLDIGIYLRSYITSPNVVDLPDISENQELLDFIKNLVKEENRFYRGFRNQILDLGIQKKYFPKQFELELPEFWNSYKDSLSDSDWSYFPVLLREPKTNTTTKIIDEILDWEIDDIHKKRIGVFALNGLYGLTDRYDPSQIHDHLKVNRDHINKILIVPDNILDAYEEFIATVHTENPYDFHINKIEYERKGIVTINEFPYNGVDFLRSSEFFRLHDLGFHLITNEAVDDFPVQYNWYFHQSFLKAYRLLGLHPVLEFNYDYTYDNKGKPSQEKYDLHLINEGKKHSISFVVDFQMINIDAFIAINNKLLESINSEYRFLKLKGFTYFVLVKDSGIEKTSELFNKRY